MDGGPGPGPLWVGAVVAALAWCAPVSASAGFLRGLVEAPSVAERRAAWPKAARGEEGFATVACRADPAGHLSDCGVLFEAPQGKGIGEALVGLAPKYRVRPVSKTCAKFMDTAILSMGWPAPDEPPDWELRPSREMLSWTYPQRAKQRGQSGYAAIVCVADDQGRASDCRAIFDAPAGEGFGAAAVKLGPMLRLKPARTKGKAVASYIALPINYFRYTTGCEAKE